MSYSTITGSGEVVQCNLGEKVRELYENIYLEIDNIKSKYKEIIKGIVVDKKKYDHVLLSIINIFNSNSSEDLIEKLNRLNSSYNAFIHYKFFLQKFKLEEGLHKSFKSVLSKYNKSPSGVYEDMHTIYNLAKSKKYKRAEELKKNIYSFENLLYSSKFDSIYLEEYKKNNKPYVIPKITLKGIVELNSIVESIDKLKGIHNALFNDINNLYKSSQELIHEVNLFNQTC